MIKVVSQRPHNMPAFESARLLTEARRRYAAGDAAGAVALLEQLARTCPNDPQLLLMLGSARTALGRIDEARTALKAALRLRPDDAAVHYELAATCRREGRFEEAQRILDTALRLKPDDPTIVSAKAGCHFMTGEVDAARGLLQPLLDRGVRHPGVVMAFARLCPRLALEDEGVALLRQCLGQHDLPAIVRSDALFQMGDLLDRLGEYDAAFEAFREANTLRAARFDPAAFRRTMDDLIGRTWTAARLKQLPRSTLPSDRPVFIVGMPRSGTSLIEQILASHPKVHGAGELNDIPRLVHDWQGDLGGMISVLTDLEPLEQRAVDRAAREYLEHLDRLAPRARRVTDKMPLNFLHLGVIALLFPRARVIHCARDPLDTCLSCYMHNFAGNNPFVYDLEHLGRFHREYQRVMAHWKQVLDLAMLEVVYEDLVADQSAVSRRMIEFIGLEWNDACLRFHENKRVVLTLSHDQVRKPMNTASIGRYRHYERHLAPLRNALAGAS